MSISKKQNAFPTTHHSGRGASTKEGMSLRDYFAAKAMQGLLESVERYSFQRLSDYAYKLADKMLERRDMRDGDKWPEE